jgi:hypothetical protein
MKKRLIRLEEFPKDQNDMRVDVNAFLSLPQGYVIVKRAPYTPSIRLPLDSARWEVYGNRACLKEIPYLKRNMRYSEIYVVPLDWYNRNKTIKSLRKK